MKTNDLRKFAFKKVSCGAYRVTYTTDRGDYYDARIEDMTLIDDTLYAGNAKVSDIESLRDAVKRNGAHYHSNGERY